MSLRPLALALALTIGMPMSACAQQFAGWLETVLARSPLAWFNFFSFWQQGVVMPRAEQHDGSTH